MNPDHPPGGLVLIGDHGEVEQRIVLPSKFDIHEYDIMARFCGDVADDGQREALLDAIDGRGAFQRFKKLIHRYGIQQQWYEHREQEMERILADWLEAQGTAYER